MTDTNTKQNNVPLDPRDNLKRMESILRRYKSQMEHKEQIRARLSKNRDNVRSASVADGDSKTPEAETRRSILRKYDFDLNQLSYEIGQLKGKILWAETRQIPFIQSEIEKSENAAFDEELLHLEVET